MQIFFKLVILTLLGLSFIQDSKATETVVHGNVQYTCQNSCSSIVSGGVLYIGDSNGGWVTAVVIGQYFEDEN